MTKCALYCVYDQQCYSEGKGQQRIKMRWYVWTVLVCQLKCRASKVKYKNNQPKWMYLGSADDFIVTRRRVTQRT